MERNKLNQLIEAIINEVGDQIPEYMKNQADRNISNGNVAICIIDEEGRTFGKYYGSDKNKCRGFYNIALKKSSQVWISGYATGKFEEMVYAKKITCEQFGLSKPDLIGWEGGQPVKIDDKTTLSIGFSGFTGEHDLEIVTNAVAKILKS